MAFSTPRVRRATLAETSAPYPHLSSATASGFLFLRVSRIGLRRIGFPGITRVRLLGVRLLWFDRVGFLCFRLLGVARNGQPLDGLLLALADDHRLEGRVGLHP